MHSVHFQRCEIVDCIFRRGGWINVALWESKVTSCTFSDVDIELSLFSGSSFNKVAWNRGSSLMMSCIEHCKLEQTSFNETVVDAVFRSCSICDGAFDHVVKGDSRIDTCGNDSRVPAIVAGADQDPLKDWRVYGLPTIEQLKQLDALLASAHLERHFQEFLELNPQLLLVDVGPGSHGTYVLPQVRFGSKFVADFMIGWKNSMGCFWRGLEIESPRHSVVKSDKKFRAVTNHAIDQIRDWRRVVREDTALAQMPRHQGGLGLVDIEPEFEAWVVTGRDADGSTVQARRDQYLESRGSVHVQTWDGFRERVAHAIGKSRC